MIIPTADFDPMFADDGIPFGLKMRQYIQREFSRELGPYSGLAATEKGLDVIAAIFFPHDTKANSHSDAA